MAIDEYYHQNPDMIPMTIGNTRPSGKANDDSKWDTFACLGGWLKDPTEIQNRKVMGKALYTDLTNTCTWSRSDRMGSSANDRLV